MGFPVKAMVLGGTRKAATVEHPAASLQKPTEVLLDTFHAGIPLFRMPCVQCHRDGYRVSLLPIAYFIYDF
jgi:hypothetical protein